MSKTVIVLDAHVDPLWLGHLPQTIKEDNGSLSTQRDHIISLRSISTTKYPYCYNVFGWHRWLKQNNIQQLYCYLPGRKSWAILAAATLRSIPISLYITRRLEAGELDYLKLWKHRANRFYCAGNCIGQQLLAYGVAADTIIVEPPEIQRPTASKANLVQYKRQLNLPENMYTLLSLASPQDPGALQDIVWATSVAKHAYNDICLIVSGVYRREDRLRLADWETRFNAPNLLRLHQTPEEWGMLTQVCDTVLAGSACEKEVIRLLYARAAEKPIIGAGTGYKEYTDGYDNALHVHPPRPRQFTDAILNQIQKCPSNDRSPLLEGTHSARDLGPGDLLSSE